MLHESHSLSAAAGLETASLPTHSRAMFEPGDSIPSIDSTGSLRQAIFRTQQWLLGQQHADGYWVAELEGDTILESEFLLLLAFLGEEQTPLATKCAEYLVEKQTAAGGWTQYPGGEIDISGSVKAYFALKLTGHDPLEPNTCSGPARRFWPPAAPTRSTASRGSIWRCWGRFPTTHARPCRRRSCCCRSGSRSTCTRSAAWSRTIIVPLSIMSAFRPVRADRAAAWHSRTVSVASR